MADETKDQRTKTLGYAPLSVAKKWSGWDDYSKAAAAMSDAILAASERKAPIRDHIKRELVKKGTVGKDVEIDFQVVGERVRIVEAHKPGRRSSAVNLF